MKGLDITKPVIMADLCTNHRTDLHLARSMIHRVLKAGAIPKIQLYSSYTWPHEWVEILLEVTPFIPSVFRPADIDAILPYNPLALKIASVESTYKELIDKALSTNRPVFISTGGMDASECYDLIDKVADRADVCLMHCVSQYPTNLEDVNLRRITLLEDMITDLAAFCSTGLSLHCPEYVPEICAAAVALGASHFEIHVRDNVLDNNSPDSQCAVGLATLGDLVDTIHAAYTFVGEPDFLGADYEDVRRWRERWQG